MLNWSIALLLPSLLHATTNASIMEIPGYATADAADAISATEFLVILSGISSTLTTFVLAVWCVYAARRVHLVPPHATGNGNDVGRLAGTD